MTDWIEREKACYAPLYKRFPLCLQRGEGVYLYDDQGRAYLDMASGIAVNAFGHAHPRLQAVLSSAGLWHTSNLYYTEEPILLAERLCGRSFASRVFFCNSGTEANEAVIKFARRAGQGKRPGIVAFEGSFHGRTLGALSATSTARYREPFEPLLPDVEFLPYNRVEPLKRIDDTVGLVLVEPVQGEGGVRPATLEFLQALRGRCDEVGALLAFDEVQCGLGRCGQLLAYQTFGVVPDMLSLAKPLAAGLPLGAVLLNARVAEALQVGDHGTTFGGGPLLCRVALEVLEMVDDQLLAQVQQRGLRLGELLAELRSPHIVEVRGLGLMWGVQLADSLPVAQLVEACQQRGVLVLSSGQNTLRLLPPLIVEQAHLEKLAAVLQDALDGLA